ncbi:MAG TPA: YqzM family protein [Bacillales bacterium]|nr:YqzM family protein [Bacillales bacterium]
MAENRIGNEFEKDVQDKGNDFVHATNGFIYSFLFFTVIFAIGVVISLLAR